MTAASATSSSKFKHASATEADLAVVDRMPDEGVSGPVVLFHNEKDLPLGFLSNFFPAPIIIAGCDYITSEHYFQCGKARQFNPALHERIRTAATPGLAAEIGKDRANSIRPDWENVKEDIMFDALVAKFTQHPLLLHALMQTNYTMLVEHTRRDKICGDAGDHSGQNRLGVLLMQLREMFRAVSMGAAIAQPDMPGEQPMNPAAVKGEFTHTRFAFEEVCPKLDKWPGLDAVRIAIARSYATTDRRWLLNEKWEARRLTRGEGKPTFA